MDNRSKKLVNVTLISIVACVIAFIVSMVLFIILENVIKDGTNPIFNVLDFISIVVTVVWPVINILLSVAALVTSVKHNKSKVVMAVVELSLSVVGPVLYSLTYLLGALDPGV